MCFPTKEVSNQLLNRISLYNIYEKECDASISTSHSFTCPFAYCSAAHHILFLCTSHSFPLHIAMFFSLHHRLVHVDKGRCSEIKRCCIKVFIVRWESTKLPYAEPHVSLIRFLFLLILYKPFLLLKRWSYLLSQDAQFSAQSDCWLLLP